MWTGRVNEHGYGRFHIGNRQFYAHRYFYEILRAPIPAGLVLDHLCRVPRCVNPDHLEPVTRGENVRRGKVGELNSARLKRWWADNPRTHCPQGHAYTPENARRYGKHHSLVCRECNRLRANAHRSKRK
jgi:hypothetical protein